MGVNGKIIICMNNGKIKILAVTGIRSEYDLMYSVYKNISKKKNIQLSFFVTGAHLSKKHGYTVRQIEKDKFRIIGYSKSLFKSNSLESRFKSISIQIKDLIKSIKLNKPNLLLVAGDREESISTALAGSYMNIPIIHVSGGDRVVGNVDDQIRHAVTKLCHIHFTTNDESKNRILKMGEQPFRVFNVGNPGIDRLIQEKKISSNELSKLINFKIDYKEKYIVLIQHPLSSEFKDSYRQMKITLEAVKQLKIKTIIISPNSDPGNRDIKKAIKEFDHLKFVYNTHHLKRTTFVNLLRNCSCLLGNSSAGILEAPSLRLPTVNIGNRQKERLHSGNVQFVTHDVKMIKKAIKKALFDKKYIARVNRCKNPYGEGKTGKKIANILSKIKIDKKLMIKDITY